MKILDDPRPPAGSPPPAGRPLRWWPRRAERRERSRRLEDIAATPLPDPEEDEAQYRPIDLGIVRRVLARLKPHRRQYALGISLGVVMVGLELLSPLFVRHLIDLSTGYAEGTLPGAPARADVEWRLCQTVGVWALLLGVVLVLQRAAILIMTRAGERVQFDLRREIFAHLQALSMSFYDRTKLGRIISRCTSDLNGLRDINVWGVDTVVKNALIMIFAGGMLLRTEPRLFAAVAWLAPLLYVCNRVFRRKISLAWQVVREGFTRVSTNLAENITGVRVVTAFNRQSWNLQTFDKLQHINTANNLRAARINGLYQPCLQLIGFAGRAVILLYGGYLVAGGYIQGIGSVVAAFLYWDYFMGPIVTFGNFHNQLMLAMSGAERIFSLLDTEPEIVDPPGAYSLPTVQGQVRFDSVSFAYKPQRPVLTDVDFEAAAGQTIALVGPTGGGKSTIISLIARFYHPQAGRILIDGHDIRGVTGESLHRQMGIVLQVNFLFTGTVLDNIRYVRPQASEADVIEAARQLGTHDAIMALSAGYHTQVGERGGNMSLGQRQMICFTRAFLANPRIMLLDEATSSVDAATEQVLQDSLQRLLAGRTTFVVAHRLSTITRAHCILVIEQGRIVERGTHRELLRWGGKYAALYDEFTALR